MSDNPRKAGSSIDDWCAACKSSRRHTILATRVGGEGPLRVICDYCGSQHNYRGGGRAERPAAQSPGRPAEAEAEAFPIVAERERSQAPMSGPESADLEMLLRRIIREECGLTPVVPADKWRGGEMVLRPGKPGLQEKSWPIETFFHKVTMIRNRLRVLEQQINALEAPADVKAKLQGYVTGCYGSLTSFNILFASEEDRFQGSSGPE